LRRYRDAALRSWYFSMALEPGFCFVMIDFPHFGFRIRPQSGMLACFPSDHRYLHAAKPTLSGTRYVLVGWAAAKGTQRVNDRLPKRSVRLNE